MDIKDFEGLTKFKLIIPGLYILSWVSMFLGPNIYPIEYQKYSIIMLLYLIIRLMIMCGTMIKININACYNFNRITQLSQDYKYQGFKNNQQEIYYGFIIPNYKEEIQLLQQTLDFIAAHKRAKQHYLIFLAMQAHQVDSDLKAKQLIQKFKQNFRVIDYTRHQIRLNQQKGKASNVSWCAENLQPILQKYMINPNQLFLTIIDADSLAPEIYFDLIEEHIMQNYDERYKFMYQPTQIFTRNYLETPIMTRVMDVFHSFAHMGNLYSSFNFTFPLSNYTLSYDLVKRMGYWDTCADAIGQDFHTTQKAYWKTGGNLIAVPIYVPFNQVNIQTGKGYWEDMKARFWQAQRHAKGVADVAYNMKMLFNQPFRLKNILVLYQVLQTFLIAATIPWILISMNYQYKILYTMQRPPPELISEGVIQYLFTVMTVIGTFTYLTYEYYKRRANTIIYKQENQSIFRIFQYLILVMILLYFVSCVTFIIASFSTLFGTGQYVVADKKNTVKKSIQQN